MGNPDQFSSSKTEVEMFGWNGTSWREVRIDSQTRALNTIGYSHHEIHAGSHYYIEGHTTLDTSGTLNVKLVTADTAKLAHFTWEIESNGVLLTQLKEDATGGMSGGTAVTPLNNYRDSTNTSSLTITSGVNPCTTGTLISNKKVGGTGFKTAFGGSAGRDDELILKRNATYCRLFESGSDGNIIAFKAMWYEHTPKGESGNTW